MRLPGREDNITLGKFFVERPSAKMKARSRLGTRPMIVIFL